ncbi:transposase [Streptomyces sp. NPDC048251]|uniref:transposase n=1 Tax=Streptomyces sp. NPDC048251 TaxID=3154501 RepID=UPI0034324861
MDRPPPPGPGRRDRLAGQAELFGIGPETAGQLPASAGDNPERMRSERAFVHLAGDARIPTSSGGTHRHRLNRGGDRAANNALHTIVLVRTRFDERTGACGERRTKGAVQEGHHALPQANRRPRGPPRPDPHTGHAHHSKRPRSSCLTAIWASRERKIR